MNVDILSFVIIIIAVDYILELRSGARAPPNFLGENQRLLSSSMEESERI